jgi:hypothetical protein
VSTNSKVIQRLSLDTSKSGRRVRDSGTLCPEVEDFVVSTNIHVSVTDRVSVIILFFLEKKEKIK